MEKQSKLDENIGERSEVNKMEELFTEEENAAEIEDLTAAKTRSRKKRKIGAREVLFIAIPVVAIIAVAILALLFVKEKKNQELPEGARQIYAGNTVEFDSDAVIKKNDGGETVLVSGGTEHVISDLPIYSGNGRSFLITEDMAYYDPMKPSFGKADQFTKFSLGSGDSVRVSKDSVEKQIPPGFLYDGRDKYIFLEEAVLDFNDMTRTLAPFSYVEVVAGDSMQIYNNGTGETEEVIPETVVTATCGDGSYVVNMNSDTLERYDGSRMLLFNQPSLLKSIMQ